MIPLWQTLLILFGPPLFVIIVIPVIAILWFKWVVWLIRRIW
jgi:hypothetical protein